MFATGSICVVLPHANRTHATLAGASYGDLGVYRYMCTLFVVHGLHGDIAAFYGSVDGLERVVREMGMDYALYFMMQRAQNINVCFQIRNTAALVRNVFGTLTDFFVLQHTKRAVSGALFRQVGGHSAGGSLESVLRICLGPLQFFLLVV